MKTNFKRFDTKNYEFNSNSEYGVYIIHGFSSSTYEIKQLAEFLGKKGFHAVANNLPGHGVTASDCNNIKYHDWFDAVKQDIAKLVSSSKKTYIVGCSMGGSLALYASSLFPVNGCIVGGTVLKFKNPFTINFTNRLLCKIIKLRNKADINLNQNIKFYGYTQYPLIALNEFRKMNITIIKNLSNIKCPTLIIHSKSDRLAIKENVHIICKNIKSEIKEKFWVNDAHHNLFDANPDQKIIFTKILDFIKTY
tara:strand:+ start:371 stop:1123 length:753 start_codon:yes stop_codon:yes gene_type:complete